MNLRHRTLKKFESGGKMRKLYGGNGQGQIS